MRCPECKNDIFELHDDRTFMVEYSENATFFDEWNEMEFEETASHTLIKCTGCGHVVIDKVNWRLGR